MRECRARNGVWRQNTSSYAQSVTQTRMRVTLDMWNEPARKSKVIPLISCLLEHCLSHSSLLHDLSVHFCPHLFWPPHRILWALHLGWILQRVRTPAQPRKEACCLDAWPNEVLSHLQHRYRRTQKKSPRQVRRPHDVEVPAVQCWETSCAIPSN